MDPIESTTTQVLLQGEAVVNVLRTSKMGIWIIIPKKGGHNRARASINTMMLFGVDKNQKMNDEEFYDWWLKRVYPDDLAIVEEYLERMTKGERCEITYRWIHPKLGIRAIRCGGIGYTNIDGKLILEGYHYDITHLLEKNQQDALVAKSLAKTFSCLLYVDLKNSLYTSYSIKNSYISKFLPSSGRINVANKIIAENLCADNEYDNISQFTDLSTLNERMKDTSTISIVCEGVYVKWIRISFLALDRNSDGTIFHLMETIRDVSSQRERELRMIHELKENNEAIKSSTIMFQDMIHEIKTPLNAMYGFSQLLCIPGVNSSDEQKQEYSNIIHNCFDMVSNLIDDVLDFVDAKHGNFRICKKDFLVNEMCRNVVRLSEMRAQEGVKVYFTSEVDDKYTINSDEQRIEQVLINFMTNSCKHTLKGEIHLHASRTENPGHLTFSVTDTGSGIPPEMADEIFKRYKKADANVKGSGLGLHISSIIAKKLGAEIKLDKNYTNGARFLLVI